MNSLSHNLKRKAFGRAADWVIHSQDSRELGFLRILDLAEKFMGDNFTSEASG